MYRKSTLAWIVALLLLAIASLAGSAAASGSYYFNFEQTVKPWAAQVDSLYKNYSLERRTGDNGCPDMFGNSYANLKFISSGPGTGAWIGTSFEGSGADVVTLDFSVKNTGICKACRPAVFVGKAAPSGAAELVDLSVPGPVPAAPAGAITPKIPIPINSWKTYHYSAAVIDAKSVYVAIGMLAPAGPEPAGAAVPEPIGQLASLGIDCVNVNIQSMTDHQ